MKLVSLEAVERERERELHFRNKKSNIVQQSDTHTSNLIDKRINIEILEAMCFSES